MGQPETQHISIRQVDETWSLDDKKAGIRAQLAFSVQPDGFVEVRMTHAMLVMLLERSGFELLDD